MGVRQPQQLHSAKRQRYHTRTRLQKQRKRSNRSRFGRLYRRHDQQHQHGRHGRILSLRRRADLLQHQRLCHPAKRQRRRFLQIPHSQERHGLRLRPFRQQRIPHQHRHRLRHRQRLRQRHERSLEPPGTIQRLRLTHHQQRHIHRLMGKPSRTQLFRRPRWQWLRHPRLSHHRSRRRAHPQPEHKRERSHGHSK